MKWYFKILGGHVHVKVYMNGAWIGDLCFREEEFHEVREHCPWIAFEEREIITERIRRLERGAPDDRHLFMTGTAGHNPNGNP